MKSVDPRLRVLYLITLSAGVFFLHALWQVALLAALQALLWLVVRLPPQRLFRQIGKLWFFILFIVVSYSLTSEDPETDRWQRFTVPGLGSSIAINTAGALLGAVMALRLLTVVLGSQVARAGDPRAIAAGLDKLRVPPNRGPVD